MNQANVLARWMAAAGPWAHFLKPSLLAAAVDGVEPLPSAVAHLQWKPEGNDVAAVLDLPALESIAMGVALGRKGWCVVPMFNTVHGEGEVLETWDVIRALLGAVPDLPEKPSGPPVFLLDSGRQSGSGTSPRAFDFDNRWYVFASDFPSAEFFTSKGIGRLLVVTRGNDLLPDIRDAFAAHSTLQRFLVNPDDGQQVPFPAPRAAIWRGIASFGRALGRNWDGTFGRRISHG
ncbi:hypothetical protein LZ198_23730 [Myxococcus sp. K15C18031901]|uniref:hypothetical protein n=1 Tax=Myxococcus dinghuensis TaxID=2906761 RepID=UPI0020A6E903|nr:hypothetical protein [Myxococcus dinghuensis]MCP3101892.1 hypothetical protein [Myxococcus dinghuensis]